MTLLFRITLSALLALGLCAGCSRSTDETPQAATTPVTSTSATPTPPRTTPKPAPPKPKPKPKPKPVVRKPGLTVNPLTGAGKPPTGPVVAVKIEDTSSGRPQTGINQADVVYVQQVEGGLTRLVAVYASRKPTVGMVRSARPMDGELLRQYGRIVAVASGGGGGSLPGLTNNGLYRVINDEGGLGFYRIGSRPAPYNLMNELAAVSGALNTKAQRVKPMGLTFSKALVRGTPVKAGYAVRTRVGNTPVEFHYAFHTGRYTRYINGAPMYDSAGYPVTTPNVIVQRCRGESDFTLLDSSGSPSFYTHTVGKGSVTVYRNGRAIAGTWSRPNAAAPTTYTDSRGKPIPLAPGGSWVILAGIGAP